MTTHHFRRSIAALGLALALGTASARATTYNVTPINVSGSNTVAVNAINSNATPTMAGQYMTGLQNYHSFTYTAAGGVSAFDPAGSMWSWGMGVNNAGLVTGTRVTSSWLFEGYLKNGSTVSILHPEGTAVNTWLGGINNSSVTTGYYANGSTYYGLIYNIPGNTVMNFGLSGVTGTFGRAINNVGYAAGYASKSTNPIMVGYTLNLSTAAATTYAIPGYAQTYIYGINDSNIFVGAFTNDGHTLHGWVKTSTGYFQFDVPGASSTEVHGINNAGWLVGTYSDATGAHGFYAVPSALTTADLPSPLKLMQGALDAADFTSQKKVTLSTVLPVIEEPADVIALQ